MPARFECSRDSNSDSLIPNNVAHSHQDQLNRRSTSSSQQGPSTRSCSLCSRTGQGPREESGRCSRTSNRRHGELYAFVSISLSCEADSISQHLYTASVGVGAGTYSLIVDTGSSNTWVGANSNNPYQPGPHSHDTGSLVSVKYGSGRFVGRECECLPLLFSSTSTM